MECILYKYVSRMRVDSAATCWSVYAACCCVVLRIVAPRRVVVAL